VNKQTTKMEVQGAAAQGRRKGKGKRERM